MQSKSDLDTKESARELWRNYSGRLGKEAIIIALTGDMGAGKTVFTKGLAEALGIKTQVVSPTFVLQISHAIPGTKIKLEHIDAWRMETGAELEELNLDRMIEERSVVLIEWADRVTEPIRSKKGKAVTVWVKIGYGTGNEERTIEWRGE